MKLSLEEHQINVVALSSALGLILIKADRQGW
jgi:hypothetical protein